MLDIDWNALFIPTESVLEIVIRGTVIYLMLFAAIRFLPRRTVGALGPSDLLVLVLIADAVQNAMAGGYESITEGVVLATVIFGWATFIDWLDYKFPQLNIAQAHPLTLVENGKFIYENMKRQQVTEDEVMSQLRQHGQDSPERVARAVLEGDGHFSVIMRNREPMQSEGRRNQF